MIALDTNVLVRIVVDDPGAPSQVKAARECARRAKQIFVPQLVQAELGWVLESSYHLDKPAVLTVLEQLLNNHAVGLQHAAIYAAAVAAYRGGSADFADYLILHEGGREGAPLVTFDKRLAKSPGASLLVR